MSGPVYTKNGYKAFYGGKQVEVEAFTSYKAQQWAAERFKLRPHDWHKVAVVLCEKAGEQVVHLPLM